MSGGLYTQVAMYVDVRSGPDRSLMAGGLYTQVTMHMYVDA